MSVTEPRSDDRPILTGAEIKLVLVVLLLFGLGLSAVAVKRLGLVGSTVPVVLSDPRPHPVDVNRAPWWELATLPGIGQARAQAIVQLRRQRKGLRSLDELSAVRGIGPATVKRLEPLLVLGAYEEEPEPGEDRAEP